RRLSIVLIIGDQQSDLEEARAGIEQRSDALAGGEFPGAMLLVDSGITASLPQAVFQFPNLFDQMAHVCAAREFGGGVGGHNAFRAGPTASIDQRPWKPDIANQHCLPCSVRSVWLRL